MIFGRMRFTAPCMTHPSGPRNSGACLPLPLLVREIEIQEHHHARFRVEPARAMMPPDRDAHVVVEEVQQPEGPTSEKGTAKRRSRLDRDLVFR